MSKIRLTYLFIIVTCFQYDDIFCQESFFINNLIEKDGRLFRPFLNEPVYGDIYRDFLINNKKSEKVFIGHITENGKQGKWTRYWNNAKKKEEGYFIDSKKDGLWIEWMENGEKYAEIFYRKGLVVHLTNCIVDNCL